MPSIDLQLNVDHTLPLSSLISEATENLSLLQHHWNGAKLTRCSAIFFPPLYALCGWASKVRKTARKQTLHFLPVLFGNAGRPYVIFRRPNFHDIVRTLQFSKCRHFPGCFSWRLECWMFGSYRGIHLEKSPPPTPLLHTPKLQNGEYMSQTNWVLPWRREHQAPPGGIVVTELQPRLRRYKESEVKTQNRQWL